MTATPSTALLLPRYLFRKSLLNVIGPVLPHLIHDRPTTNSPVTPVTRFLDLDFSHVRFVDDAAALLLLAVEHELLHFGYGIRLQALGAELSALRRQFLETGMLELLMAHRQLWSAGDGGREDSWLSDTGSLPTKALASRVMKLTFCRNLQALDHRSSEQRKIEEFDNIYRRRHFVGSMSAGRTKYTLVESGEFRNLLLQQTRYNIAEHAGATIGLSIARIFSLRDLQDDWGLSDGEMVEVTNIDSELSLVSKLHGNNTKLLRLCTIDNGVGIPETLEHTFKQTLSPSGHLPGMDPQSTEVSRFAEATKGWSRNERLCSFSTYPEGTRKPLREKEPKGLTTLKTRFAIELKGYLSVHSAGATVTFHSEAEDCGRAESSQYHWTKGGTEVIITVPLQSSLADEEAAPAKAHPFVPSPQMRQHVEELDLNAELSQVRSMQPELLPPAVEECAHNVVQRLLLPQKREDAQRLLLPQKDNVVKLVVVDWSELFITKDRLSLLFRSIANELRQAVDAHVPLAPFVFANVPSSALGVVPEGLSHFPIPVCVFYDSNRQWKWLGLECEGLKPTLAPFLTLKAKKLRATKLSYRVESTAETLCRTVFDELLQAKTYMRCTDLADFPDKLRTHTLALLDRCPLFEQKGAQPRREELPSRTNLFKPVVDLADIGSVILNGFCNKLRDAIRQPPVCIHKTEGIRTVSNWVVENFYRCDFLVQHKILDELGSELVDVALAILQHSRAQALDYVVSCTSPTHWFVNRICDGLRSAGYDCGRHVFRKRSSITEEVRGLGIVKGTNVLLFTDLISSGALVEQMCQALEERGAVVVGLIALVDARTKDEMEEYSTQNPDPLERFRAGTAVPLTTIQEPKHDPKNRRYGFYIDPETLTPKPIRSLDIEEQWHHFFADVFSGKGGVTSSATFASPDALVQRLSECGALIYGHFIHGTNHSNILCDARKVFGDDLLRNEIVTNLAKYILRNKIALVVSPNHSNVYLLTQALRYRFKLAEEEGSSWRLQFATALRVQSTIPESDYQLTGLGGDMNREWSGNGAVLILDDGVCSGTTIKALIREVVNTFYKQGSPPLRIHVIAFVNRLSENDTAFWNALDLHATGTLDFSYFMALPLPAHPREHCPVCKQQDEVDRFLQRGTLSDYAPIFYREWKKALAPVDLYTLPPSQKTEVLSGEPVRILAAHLIALRRGNVRLVWQKIRGYENATVVITVLGNLLLRSYDIHTRDPEPDEIIRELLRYAKMPERNHRERLYILRKLIQFARLGTSPNAMAALAGEVLEAYTPALDERPIVGGLEVLFSQLLSGGRSREDNFCSGARPDDCRQQVLEALEAAVQKSSDVTSRGHLSWLIHSLSTGQTELKSVGAAVLRLASHNRLTPQHHSQRITLQEVSSEIRRLLTRREGAATEKHRLATLCRAALGFFREMYDCARILAHQSEGLDAAYQDLNRRVDGLKQLEDELSALLQDPDKQQQMLSLARLFDIVERLRVAWFAPPHERIKQFVRSFAITPVAEIREAASGYEGKAVINLDGLKGLEHTLALFPRHEFGELVRHLHRHLDEKGIPGQVVLAAWQQEAHPFERGKLVLALRNSGTRARESAGLRGLQRFQDGLRQFGGNLYPQPDTGELNTSYNVKIELHIWE